MRKFRADDANGERRRLIEKPVIFFSVVFP